MKKSLLICLLVLYLFDSNLRGESNWNIAFTGENQNLYVMKADGSSLFQVPFQGLPAFVPQWSQDGQWLTVSGGVHGGADIYVVKPDGTSLTKVTNIGWAVFPCFSPDGSQIIFQRVYEKAYSVNVDGTNLIDLGFYASHTRLSPDGTKISYSDWGTFTYNSDAFVYDSISDISTQITHHEEGGAFNYAVWSPDGTKLALQGLNTQTGSWDIWISDADGANLVDITPDWSVSQEVWPAWSPDGQYLFFNSDSSGNTDIWKMKVDGTERVNLTNTPNFAEFYPAIGVVPESDPIQEILDFIDESVADGTLVPAKSGPAGKGQLGALINMIKTAGELIKAEDIAGACGQLHAALGKTDGQKPPPDFVTGPASAELAQMIQDLMASLGCN